MRKIAIALIAALLPAAAGAFLELGNSLAGDCRQARDPRRCAARLEAHSACRDQVGAARRRCQAALLPAPDCAKAAQPSRCQDLQAARSTCQGKSGAAYRRCMKQRLPDWRSYQAG